MRKFYGAFALTYIGIMTVIVLAAIIFIPATPAIGKDLHCTPKGGCSDQIRVSW